MTMKRMVVKVTPDLWEELNLDNPDNYIRVRNGFYMSFGLEELRRLVQLPKDHVDVVDLNTVAPQMGVTARDRITKR